MDVGNRCRLRCVRCRRCAARLSVAALGLRIVRPAPDGNEECRAFNWDAGTTVVLILSSADGGLVALDRDASKVTSFTDDQGKDLTKAEVKGGFGGGFEHMPIVSKRRKAVQHGDRSAGRAHAVPRA